MFKIVVNVVSTNNTIPTGIVVLKYGKRTVSVGKLTDGVVMFHVDMSEYAVKEIVAYYQGDSYNAPGKTLSINYSKL